MQWDTDLSIKTQVMEKGYIAVDDIYRFRLIIDVANQLFFKNYKGFQQAAFKIIVDDEPAVVWFPTISTKAKAEHSQWLNYLNEDCSVITEKNIREDGKATEHELGQLRIVFGKMKDSFGRFNYRYIGNFRLTKISEGNLLRTYTKVSDNLNIDYDNEEFTI